MRLFAAKWEAIIEDDEAEKVKPQLKVEQMQASEDSWNRGF